MPRLQPQPAAARAPQADNSGPHTEERELAAVNANAPAHVQLASSEGDPGPAEELAATDFVIEMPEALISTATTTGGEEVLTIGSDSMTSGFAGFPTRAGDDDGGGDDDVGGGDDGGGAREGDGGGGGDAPSCRFNSVEVMELVNPVVGGNVTDSSETTADRKNTAHAERTSPAKAPHSGNRPPPLHIPPDQIVEVNSNSTTKTQRAKREQRILQQRHNLSLTQTACNALPRSSTESSSEFPVSSPSNHQQPQVLPPHQQQQHALQAGVKFYKRAPLLKNTLPADAFERNLALISERNPQMSLEEKMLAWQCDAELSDVEDVNSFDWQFKKYEETRRRNAKTSKATTSTPIREGAGRSEDMDAATAADWRERSEFMDFAQFRTYMLNKVRPSVSTKTASSAAAAATTATCPAGGTPALVGGEKPSTSAGAAAAIGTAASGAQQQRRFKTAFVAEAEVRKRTAHHHHMQQQQQQHHLASGKKQTQHSTTPPASSSSSTATEGDKAAVAVNGRYPSQRKRALLHHQQQQQQHQQQQQQQPQQQQKILVYEKILCPSSSEEATSQDAINEKTNMAATRPPVALPTALPAAHRKNNNHQHLGSGAAAALPLNRHWTPTTDEEESVFRLHRLNREIDKHGWRGPTAAGPHAAAAGGDVSVLCQSLAMRSAAVPAPPPQLGLIQMRLDFDRDEKAALHLKEKTHELFKTPNVPPKYLGLSPSTHSSEPPPPPPQQASPLPTLLPVSPPATPPSAAPRLARKDRQPSEELREEEEHDRLRRCASTEQTTNVAMPPPAPPPPNDAPPAGAAAFHQQYEFCNYLGLTGMSTATAVANAVAELAKCNLARRSLRVQRLQVQERRERNAKVAAAEAKRKTTNGVTSPQRRDVDTRAQSLSPPLPPASRCGGGSAAWPQRRQSTAAEMLPPPAPPSTTSPRSKPRFTITTQPSIKIHCQIATPTKRLNQADTETLRRACAKELVLPLRRTLMQHLKTANAAGESKLQQRTAGGAEARPQKTPTMAQQAVEGRPTSNSVPTAGKEKERGASFEFEEPPASGNRCSPRFSKSPATVGLVEGDERGGGGIAIVPKSGTNKMSPPAAEIKPVPAPNGAFGRPQETVASLLLRDKFQKYLEASRQNKPSIFIVQSLGSADSDAAMEKAAREEAPKRVERPAQEAKVATVNLKMPMRPASYNNNNNNNTTRINSITPNSNNKNIAPEGKRNVQTGKLPPAAPRMAAKSAALSTPASRPRLQQAPARNHPHRQQLHRLLTRSAFNMSAQHQLRSRKVLIVKTGSKMPATRKLHVRVGAPTTTATALTGALRKRPVNKSTTLSMKNTTAGHKRPKSERKVAATPPPEAQQASLSPSPNKRRRLQAPLPAATKSAASTPDEVDVVVSSTTNDEHMNLPAIEQQQQQQQQQLQRQQQQLPQFPDGNTTTLLLLSPAAAAMTPNTLSALANNVNGAKDLYRNSVFSLCSMRTRDSSTQCSGDEQSNGHYYYNNNNTNRNAGSCGSNSNYTPKISTTTAMGEYGGGVDFTAAMPLENPVNDAGPVMIVQYSRAHSQSLQRRRSNPLSSVNGRVLHIYHELDVLIVVQEALVSFWRHSKLLNLLARTAEQKEVCATTGNNGDSEGTLSGEWLPLGECSYACNDVEVYAPFANRLCVHNSMPLYVELRCREVPHSKRDCTLLSMYINVYYFNEEEMQAKMHSIQLDSVQSLPQQVIYTTITESRYFVMSWPQHNMLGKVRAGICKYSLTPHLDTLASIREFKSLRHEIKQLQCLNEDKLIGFGATTLTLWDHRSGDILMNYDLELPLGRNLGCVYYPSFEVGQSSVLLMYQHLQGPAPAAASPTTKQSELLLIACNVSHSQPSYRVLQRDDLPLPAFADVSTAINTGDHIVLRSPLSDEELWLNCAEPNMIMRVAAQHTQRFYAHQRPQVIELSDGQLTVDSFANYVLKLVANGSGGTTGGAAGSGGRVANASFGAARDDRVLLPSTVTNFV